MGKWILGLLTGLAILVQSLFVRRTEERLTQERDTARVKADEAEILAEGRENESAVLMGLQKKHASLDALHGDDLVDELNARNK